MHLSSKLRSILEVEFQYWCIYFETQKDTCCILFQCMYLCSNSRYIWIWFLNLEAGPNLENNGSIWCWPKRHFKKKKNKKKQGTTNFTTSYSNHFQSVFHKNKTLHNFHNFPTAGLGPVKYTWFQQKYKEVSIIEV